MQEPKSLYVFVGLMLFAVFGYAFVVMAAPVNFMQGGNSFGAFAVLGTNDNFDLAFKTFNAERARFDTTGNFGIGTVNPQAKLNVVGGEFWLFNDGQNPRIVLGDSGAVGQYGFSQWDSLNDYYRIETDGTNGLKVKGNNVSIGNIFPSEPLIVGLGSSELFRINSAGNVGIGTTAPVAKLDVVGTVDITGNTTIGGALQVAGVSTLSGGAVISCVGCITNTNVTSALIGKTYNGFSLASQANGFTVSGGTTPHTLTVSGSDVSLNQSLATTSSPTFTAATLLSQLNLNGPLSVSGNVGTSGQIFTSAGTSTVPIWQTIATGGSYKRGQASIIAAGTQVITHNLGIVPKLIKIRAYFNREGSYPVSISDGSAENISNQSTTSLSEDYPNVTCAGQNSTKIVWFIYPAFQCLDTIATATLSAIDSVTFTLNWVINSFPGYRIYFQWEVYN